MITPSYQWLAYIGFQEARSHHDGCRRRKTLAALRRVEGLSYPRVTVVAVPWLPSPLGCPVAMDRFPFCLGNASPGCTVDTHAVGGVAAVGCVSQVRLSGERNVTSVGKR